VIVTADGIAGFLSGAAQVSTGGFEAGASIGLKFNRTGAPVHETVTLGGRDFAIDFATGNAVYQFFGSGSINIANFVTIEGSFSISNGQLGAEHANIFLGQGPAFRDDGSINPS